MRRRGPITETTEIDVAFHDVDMMNVVWHGHYLKYLETARWRLMDRLNYGYAAMRDSGYIWPIIETHVRHIRGAAFRDRLEVSASLVEWQCRLAINYLITDAKSRERVARARTVQVAVLRSTGELQFAPPPDFIRRVESGIAGLRT